MQITDNSIYSQNILTVTNAILNVIVLPFLATNVDTAPLNI